jgi:hypothetical protein
LLQGAAKLGGLAFSGQFFFENAAAVPIESQGKAKSIVK